MDIVLEDDGDSGIILINTAFGAGNNNTAIVSTVADGNYVVEGMGGGKANGRDFTAGGTWSYIRLYNGTGSGQVARIADRGVGFVRVDRVWDTTSNVAGDTTAMNQSLWGRMHLDWIGVPLDSTWFAAPGGDTQYIVAEGTQWWLGYVDDRIDGRVYSDDPIPALQSVREILADQVFEDLNDNAQTRIAAYRTTIINSMGQDGGGSFLGNNDFLHLPVMYMGAWDGADIHNGGAYFPNLVNCQPVDAGVIVMPRQFGPRNAAAQDVFQAAAAVIIGGGTLFADDWNLYHRRQGNVHCATSAEREIPSDSWWEEDTP